MAIYKRGAVYWYGFWFGGQRVQRSTKQGNPRVARQIEAACKTALAKSEMGITERRPAPTLKDFSRRFMEYIQTRCAEKPATVGFYAEKLTRVLKYEPMAEARLDTIDEALIESFVQHRRKAVSPASVNRELATLRRALRMAEEWRILGHVPRIRMLSGERVREFVLSREQERLYLETAPQPLRDLAVLILDSGVRRGEGLSLQWPDVRLVPVNGAHYGFLRVRGGKSKNAQRNVPLTARVRAMLEGRRLESKSAWVFPSDDGGPFLGSSVDHQHSRVRDLLRLPADFVVHSLRHTMLTRLGESGADAFTIMRVAGHSTVTVSQRYVHPSPETVERAFERLERLNAGATESPLGESKRLPPTTVLTTPESGQ